MKYHAKQAENRGYFVEACRMLIFACRRIIQNSISVSVQTFCTQYDIYKHSEDILVRVNKAKQHGLNTGHVVS